jgi:hypothetical protein
MVPQAPWLMLLVSLVVPAPAEREQGGEIYQREDVAFVSHGVSLSGSLVIPRGRIHAAVVFIHGSGPQTRNLGIAERFAAAGIGALVYDKRGVGKSGGQYEGRQNVSEKNISLLADDAASALSVLAKHPRLVGVSLGLAGISQAGWIAPIAAARSPNAKLLVLWSGPVCKVSDEDIYSKYTADSDGRTVPTYQEALAARTERYVWPDFLGRDTDSSEDLGRLSIPGLWIFGDNDGSIPVDLSITGLRALQARGHKFEYLLIRGQGHNNLDRTFTAATDWIAKIAAR